MAENLDKWPSKRGSISKIMPSDGCTGDRVPSAVGRWYNFHEFGCHLGDVGQRRWLQRRVTKYHPLRHSYAIQSSYISFIRGTYRMGANSMNESTLTRTKFDTLGLDVGIVGRWVRVAYGLFLLIPLVFQSARSRNYAGETPIFWGLAFLYFTAFTVAMTAYIG